jgi:hypothetical protein
MRTSARSANLQGLLADEDIQPLIINLMKSMKSIQQEDIRGFRKATLLDPTLDFSLGKLQMDSITLNVSDHDLLCAHIARSHPNQNLRLGFTASLIKEISRKGVCYGSSGSSRAGQRNSAIIYELNQTNSKTVLHQPAIIRKIIQYSFAAHAPDMTETTQITNVYLFVQELSQVDASIDPYRKFGFAGGYLCHRPQSEISCVITLSQVVSHFALTTFPDREEKYHDIIHVLPLDRVSSILYLHLQQC